MESGVSIGSPLTSEGLENKTLECLCVVRSPPRIIKSKIFLSCFTGMTRCWNEKSTCFIINTKERHVYGICLKLF